MRDQADGLRRLLAKDFLRIVTVTSGRNRVGKTSAVINLAAALARAGRDVLVIDENTNANNLSGSLGLRARYDLLDVIRGSRQLERPGRYFHSPCGARHACTGQT
jgi:flagellar biosynthesis protein FlhG